MPITKTERAKLRSMQKRASRIECDARKLAKDVSKELVRQMRKS